MEVLKVIGKGKKSTLFNELVAVNTLNIAYVDITKPYLISAYMVNKGYYDINTLIGVIPKWAKEIEDFSGKIYIYTDGTESEMKELIDYLEDAELCLYSFNKVERCVIFLNEE